jgi:hypothetical protein
LLVLLLLDSLKESTLSLFSVLACTFFFTVFSMILFSILALKKTSLVG